MPYVHTKLLLKTLNYIIYTKCYNPHQYELLMHSSTTTVPNCQSLKPTKKLFISESFETRPGWLTLPLEWNPGGAVPTPPKSPERGNQLLPWRWLSRLWWSRGLYVDDSDSDHDNNVSGLARPLFVLSLLPNSLSWSQWQVHIIHHLFYHQGFKALFSCFLFLLFFFIFWPKVCNVLTDQTVSLNLNFIWEENFLQIENMDFHFFGGEFQQIIIFIL